jgi:hypothetical protein
MEQELKISRSNPEFVDLITKYVNTKDSNTFLEVKKRFESFSNISSVIYFRDLGTVVIKVKKFGDLRFKAEEFLWKLKN